VSRKSRQQDPDVKEMTVGRLRREVMRLRRAVRKHRDAQGNARCWHNDLKLYEAALPEAEPAGRMDQPIEELLRNCQAYIKRQQCDKHSCLRSKKNIKTEQ